MLLVDGEIEVYASSTIWTATDTIEFGFELGIIPWFVSLFEEWELPLWVRYNILDFLY